MTDGERDPDEMSFGDWLVARRGRRAQNAVAKEAGISNDTLRYYEIGYRTDNQKPVKPTARVVRPLARALRVPVREAFRRAGIPESELRPEDFVDDVEHQTLAREIGLLDVLDRQALRQIVKGLLFKRGYVAPEDIGTDSGARGEDREDHSVGEPAAAPTATGPAEIADDPVPDREEESDSGWSG